MDKLQPLFEKPSNTPLPMASRELPSLFNDKHTFIKKENAKNKYSNFKPIERPIDQFYPNRKFNSTYGGKELQVPERLMQFNKIPRVEIDDGKRMTFEQDRNARYKTEICRNFKERSNCIYGNQCQFAHGKQELRDSMKSNKYKTKYCDKYWGTGYCAYGPRCNYLHYEADGTTGNEKLERYEDSSVYEEKVENSNISVETGDFSSDKSDSFLAETVKEVMNQIEKDKLRCNPKLDDLFMKLKRALPSQRDSKH